jgi:hypothetical protein
VARTAPQLHARLRAIERISCFEPLLDPMLLQTHVYVRRCRRRDPVRHRYHIRKAAAIVDHAKCFHPAAGQRRTDSRNLKLQIFEAVPEQHVHGNGVGSNFRQTFPKCSIVEP